MIQIPVQNKKAVIAWKNLTSQPDLSKFKGYDRAILTGKVSNIIVVDIDMPKSNKDEKDGLAMMKEFNALDIKTRIVKTKNNGYHLYFKYDKAIKQTTGLNGYSIDIRSDGGYIVAPPSKGYKTITDEEICIIPKAMKDWIMTHYKETPKKQKEEPKQAPTETKTDKETFYVYSVDEVKDLLYSLPSRFYDNRADWLKITSILKSENLFDLWDSFSKKSKAYDKEKNMELWNSLNPKMNISMINHLLEKQKKIKVSLTKKLKMFTRKPDQIRNERYMFDPKGEHKPDFTDLDIENNRHILIKSATGTGKTESTAALVKLIKSKKNYRFLSIVSRISLARQHKKNFKDMNLTFYQDIKPDEYDEQENLTVVLDSIIHLQNFKQFKNTILYLDEIHSLIDYLENSDTLKNRRLQVYNMFCILVRSCAYVVGIDADLSDTVVRFFEYFEIKPKIIHNKFQNASGKATEYKDCNKLIAIMKAKLKKNEYFVCCFDSMRYQEMVVEELKSYCERNDLDCKKDFLIYSSRDGKDGDLDDVSTAWKDKYVFYTPKIVYGIDFVPDAPMDVFAFFKCQSVNPLAFSQMVSRCRKIKHLRYTIEERNVSLEYMNPTEIKDNYNDVISYYQKAIDDIDGKFEAPKPDPNCRFLEFDPRTNEVVIKTSLFDELFYLQQYYNAVMRSAMNYHFRSILEEKGYTVLTNNEIAKFKVDEKNMTEKAKEENERKIERAVKDKEESLTASEKKIKEQMESRAKILKIDIDDESYREVLADDREFVSHLNVSSIMNTDFDEKFVDQFYQDHKVKNIKSNINKIKMIKKVEQTLDLKPFCIDFDNVKDRFNENVHINAEDQNVIQKVFRFKEQECKTFRQSYNLLISMYRNICKGMISTEPKWYEGSSIRAPYIENDKMKYHLNLINKRNHQMSNIEKDTMDYFEYEIPERKKQKKIL